MYMDKKIELLFKSKPMLMREPKSVHKLNFPINGYSEIMSELKNYKKDRFHKNYLINSLFSFHMDNDNHILLVKLKDEVISLCICRVSGCELFYYLGVGVGVGSLLCDVSYVGCYI